MDLVARLGDEVAEHEHEEVALADALARAADRVLAVGRRGEVEGDEDVGRRPVGDRRRHVLGAVWRRAVRLRRDRCDACF